MKKMWRFVDGSQAVRVAVGLALLASPAAAPCPVASEESSAALALFLDPVSDVDASVASDKRTLECGESDSIEINVPALEKYINRLPEVAVLGVGRTGPPPSDDKWDEECQKRNPNALNDFKFLPREGETISAEVKAQCQQIFFSRRLSIDLKCEIPSNAERCERNSCAPYPDVHFDPCKEGQPLARTFVAKLAAMGEAKPYGDSSITPDVTHKRDCAIFAYAPALQFNLPIGCTECDRSTGSGTDMD